MKNVNEIYLEAIKKIWEEGRTTKPRGFVCKELLGQTLVFNPNDNVITLEGLKTNMRYAKLELEWYKCGSNRLDYDPLIERVWTQYSDDGVTVNSAYGQYFFDQLVEDGSGRTQWKWIKDKLSSDNDTRQAVLNINQVKHKYDTKDMPCTICCQVLIRNNKLYWITMMRSNDVFKGLRNDLYCFTELQKQLAKELGIETGDYIHFAGSFHLYEEDYEKAKKVLGK